MKIKVGTAGLQGRFRCVVSRDQNALDVQHDTGFFDNLITNVGMNRIGTVDTNGSNGITSFNTLCGRFVVGSGQNTPQFTDTTLAAPLVFAPGNVSLEKESSSYAQGYYEIVVRYQFGQGVAKGNVSEIGIQHTSLSGPLWSRALILDANGDPTTITVLDTDFLTCYYSLRIMIPKEDVVFNSSVNYDGTPTPTTITVRPLTTEAVLANTGWGLQTSGTSGVPGAVSFFSGGLAPPTAQNPLGTQVGNLTNTAQVVPYVPDSFEKWVTRTASVTAHNGELHTCYVNCLMGRWQMNFNPPIQKDDTKTMDMTFGYSWARA